MQEKMVRSIDLDPRRVLNNEAFAELHRITCNTPATGGGGGGDAPTDESLPRLCYRTGKTRPRHTGATKFSVTVVGPVGFEPTTSGPECFQGRQRPRVTVHNGLWYPLGGVSVP